ncbi:hypothetical protein [Kribbella antiqua]|uniref:hypothetical protein n=1 Tax=Kribbella antiqua TaxID=2512217 RepID=UPI0013054547|nr:hypothetical protein [Kribbella antiqua]
MLKLGEGSSQIGDFAVQLIDLRAQGIQELVVVAKCSARRRSAATPVSEAAAI